MTKLLWGLAAAFVLLALWVTYVRPWMRKQDWAAGYFRAIEPIERALWWKSESMLWARAKMLVGTLLMTLAQAGAIDLTPLFPFLPEWGKAIVGMLPLIIALDGLVGERLRRDTTKPLEMVQVPSDAPVEVKAAEAKLEIQTEKAVEVVKVAEAAGTA